MSPQVSKQTYALPETWAPSVKANLAVWGASGKIQRLWNHDASLLVKAAQASGDFKVLIDRGRRALRVHLGKDLGIGLTALQKAFHEALD